MGTCGAILQSPISSFQFPISRLLFHNTPQIADKTWRFPWLLDPASVAAAPAFCGKNIMLTVGANAGILSDAPVQKRPPLPHREGRGARLPAIPPGRVNCHTRPCVAR